MANMFAGASHVAISGGTFVNHTSIEKPAALAFDKLSGAAAHSALHNAPARTDDTRCHQHTRTNVLDHLERWAQGICDEGVPIFWLHGGAGAGKSAIMQTLSERCIAQGLALGSFFFSRSDATRNTAEVLIPTLVYQLAQLFPSALHVLEPIIDRDPLIFKKSLQVQLISSLVQPLQHLVQLGIISDTAHSPRVFLIDGLDECDDSGQQQAIIQAVTTVCHEYRIPIKFLIASRSEIAISTTFRLFKQANHILGAMSLSDDPDAETDIRRFIENQFSKICLQHPFNESIPSGWPHASDVNKLVKKSSSHFIYASTAMRYICSAKEDPVRSLQVILGLKASRTVSPFTELDALYRHIFHAAAHLDKVLQILTHCVFARLPSSVSTICIMNEYSLSDFYIFMADMTPLINISTSEYLFPEKDVKLLHASLSDFLIDETRSGSLYINSNVYLSSKLERCIQVLDLYSQSQRTKPDWPEYTKSAITAYSLLYFQIFVTALASGHLPGTQDVLQRFGFHGFHECLLRIRSNHPEIKDKLHLEDIAVILIAVLRTSTTSTTGDSLARSYLEDLFDIFESYLSMKSTPLAPAILPLIFSGYPRRAVCDILFDHYYGEPSYLLIAKRFYSESEGLMTSVLDHITVAQLASVRHSEMNSSPERLAAAAEAILGYLVDGVRRHYSSSYSTHKLWLLRAKPGKYAATGAPILASMFHARDPSSLGLLDGPEPIMSSRGHPQQQMRKVVNLLNALLWLLPKAKLSDQIALYSNRAIPQNLYECKAGLCRRVKRCLDEYNTRFQSAKLVQLDERIENGHVYALVEKLNTLDLNSQD